MGFRFSCSSPRAHDLRTSPELLVPAGVRSVHEREGQHGPAPSIVRQPQDHAEGSNHRRVALPSRLTELLDLLVDELTRRVVGLNTGPERAKAMPDMGINSEILDHVARRGITRLVHFTRTESLKEIIEDQEIAPTWRLQRRNRAVVTNDPKRLDGHLDHVCCSVEWALCKTAPARFCKLLWARSSRP